MLLLSYMIGVHTNGPATFTRRNGSPFAPGELSAAAEQMVWDGYTTFDLVAEPGNGTRYRMVVVLGRGSVKLVAWPDMRWAIGDLGSYLSPEWVARSARVYSAGRRAMVAHFGVADADAIAGVVNALVREVYPTPLAVGAGAPPDTGRGAE